MIEDNAKSGSTVGGDKNYDTADFVAGCRERGCTPHVSQNDTNRRSAIDARTTRHPGYRISTIKRKRIEEPFGWMKTVGGLRKTRHADAAWSGLMQCSKLRCYSITSPAKVRSLGGISIPSAFEVLRLITNSNLVGCITGRSAGFAPFKIFPT
jgi:hypothetical protein